MGLIGVGREETVNSALAIPCTRLGGEKGTIIFSSARILSEGDWYDRRKRTGGVEFPLFSSFGVEGKM